MLPQLVCSLKSKGCMISTAIISPFNFLCWFLSFVAENSDVLEIPTILELLQMFSLYLIAF